LTHDPFQPTPDSTDWNPRAKGENVNQDVKHFADMTAYMDRMIGELDATLQELGIRDNTLLVFLGDNGTGRGVTSRLRDQEYRGGKGTTTRRGTHVPLIVSWPGTVKEGRVSHDLISSVDVLPTLCEAAGIPLSIKTDGISFLPQVRGERGQPREWLYHWYSPRQNGATVVTEFAFDHRHKLYRSGKFFDLLKDPNENQPLSSEQLESDAAAARKRLHAALDSFRDARPAHLEPATSTEGAQAPPTPMKKKGVGKNKKEKKEKKTPP
jgi:arylsulfatase A